MIKNKLNIYAALRSGTMMTWANYGARLLQLALVMPIAMLQFSPQEMTIWLTVEVFVSLLFVVDVGLTSTFTRLFAAVAAGKSELGFGGVICLKKGSVDQLYSSIAGTLRTVNILIAIGGSGLMLAVAWLSLSPHFEKTGSSTELILVIVGLGIGVVFTLLSNRAVALLQGMGELWRVNLLRAAANIATAFVMIFLLWSEVGVGFFVFSYLLIRVPLWYFLERAARKTTESEFGLNTSALKYDADVARFALGPTWRSAIGLIAGYAVVQMSAIIYSHTVSAREAAEVLLAIRIFDAIRMFANAPFYSQLPSFATMYAQHRCDLLLANGWKRAMVVIWLIFLGGALLALFGEKVVTAIGSDVGLPGKSFLWLFTAAIVIERVSTLQMQFFSVTNVIIWHIANFSAGIAFIMVAIWYYFVMGGFSIPMCLLVAYGVVHLPYVLYKTKGEISLFNLRFTIVGFIIPFAVSLGMAVLLQGSHA